MAELSDKGEKKIAKNFRLPGGTIADLEDLSVFFKESQAEVIARAINFLNSYRELASEYEHNQRISKLGSK